MWAEETGVLVDEAESETLVTLVICTNVIDKYDPVSEYMSMIMIGRVWSVWYYHRLLLLEFHPKRKESLTEH